MYLEIIFTEYNFLLVIKVHKLYTNLHGITIICIWVTWMKELVYVNNADAFIFLVLGNAP